MSTTTKIEVTAFEVEDEAGNRSVIVRTQPVSVDDQGHSQPTAALGFELKLRNGESVTPLSETEFESHQGRRWHKVESAR
jgi:hypothetical protein